MCELMNEETGYDFGFDDQDWELLQLTGETMDYETTLAAAVAAIKEREKRETEYCNYMAEQSYNEWLDHKEKYPDNE